MEISGRSYIFTHDSIGVGEDGPTHQPVEQLPSLRAIPGLITLRPADANEVVEAWRVIMQLRHEPVALILTRQACLRSTAPSTPPPPACRGAYVLADAAGGKPDVILMATGSEVSLCIEAYEQLKAEGVKSRVVSMPSLGIFRGQHAAYRDSVLPPAVTAASRSNRPRPSAGAATSGPGRISACTPSAPRRR